MDGQNFAFFGRILEQETQVVYQNYLPWVSCRLFASISEIKCVTNRRAVSSDTRRLDPFVSFTSIKLQVCILLNTDRLQALGSIPTQSFQPDVQNAEVLEQPQRYSQRRMPSHSDYVCSGLVSWSHAAFNFCSPF